MDIERIIRRRRRNDVLFALTGATITAAVLLVLGALAFTLVREGVSRLDLDFLRSYPSRRAERAGLLPAWVGSLLVMLVTGLTGIPLGIAAGVYLEEYTRKGWFASIIELNITNLAGVPSIVYGLMALGLFVYRFHLGPSVIAAGLTLALLVLPIVIVATRETLKSIPQNMREAAYALGATRWQVVRHHLLPYSAGGISTGVIIAMSRAIGETAPLIAIGAVAFVAFLPPAPYSADAFAVAREWAGSDQLSVVEAAVYPGVAWLGTSFTVVPIQMFNWISRPGDDFRANVAAAGIVLIVATIGLNAVAILIRHRMRRRIKW